MAKRLVACLVTILVVLLSNQAVFAQAEDTSSDAPVKHAVKKAETAVSVENAIAPTGVAKNWAMFRFDQSHSGYTEERLNFPLKLAWRYTTEIAADNPSAPSIVDGVVYFCSGHRLYAVDAATGAQKWRYPNDEPLTAVIKSTPLVGEDLVYFGGGDGKLYAITKDKGTQAWSFSTNGMMNSSPVIDNGIVYIGSSDDRLYAIDANTGQPKWPGGFRTRDDVSTSPAVSDGLVFFVSNDAVLYSAHTSTGSIKWTARVATVSRASSPVINESTLYVATGSILQAYQSQSGRIKWGTKFSSDITTIPAVAKESIYFACDNGKLYALKTDGKLKWKTPVDIGATAYGSPIISGDTVFIGANKGALMAVDAETGKIKWKYTALPSQLDTGKMAYVNIAASPTVSNGALYALADDGTLYAFRNDMPDNTAPEVISVYPSRDYLMPGTPPVEMAAVLSDLGSGINPETILMQLDGEHVEHKLIAEKGIIYYKTPRTQPVLPLKDGKHTISVQASDWAGNVLDLKWSFNVDNSLRVAPKPEDENQQGAPGMPGGMPGMPGMPGRPPRMPGGPGGPGGAPPMPPPMM